MLKVPDMRLFFEIDLFSRTYLVIFSKRSKDLKLDITQVPTELVETEDMLYMKDLTVN